MTYSVVTGERVGVDAFEVLGLPYDPDLADERVHDAYRLRLRATHPDTAAPGDPSGQRWR